MQSATPLPNDLSPKDLASDPQKKLAFKQQAEPPPEAMRIHRCADVLIAN
jgi:hypothetical protein